MSPIVSRRVALRYQVAQRYLAAKDLPMGKTFQSPIVRIWHGREILVVTDLENAGKRGKQCQEMRVTLTYQFEGDRDAWFEEVADSMLNHAGRGYQAVKGYAEFLHDQSPGAVALDYTFSKSINVEPFGEVFEFKIPQANKGHIDVRSSPTDFRVTNRHYFEGPPGKPGFFQDTSFWPRGKKDAVAFYAWMTENHERARRFMNMDMFRKAWGGMGVMYNSH